MDLKGRRPLLLFLNATMGDRRTKDYDIYYLGAMRALYMFINITYGAEVFKLFFIKYQKVKYGGCVKVHIIAVCEDQYLPGMCKHNDLGLH